MSVLTCTCFFFFVFILRHTSLKVSVKGLSDWLEGLCRYQMPTCLKGAVRSFGGEILTRREIKGQNKQTFSYFFP